jgi:hypothetical protein
MSVTTMQDRFVRIRNNMMIGIVLETLQSEHEQFNRDQDEGEVGEVHWTREPRPLSSDWNELSCCCRCA